MCGTYSVNPTFILDVANTVLSGAPSRPSRNVTNLFGSTQNLGQDTHASSGTTINAMKFVMSSILSTEPWLRGPIVVRMPWNLEMENSTLVRAEPDGSANQNLPLKFGVFWTDGVVRPHPPIERRLRLLHGLLESNGHKVKVAPTITLQSDAIG